MLFRLHPSGPPHAPLDTINMSQSNADFTMLRSDIAHASANDQEVDHHKEQQNTESRPRPIRDSHSISWWQRVGWPAGALGSAILAVIVLLVNSIVLIWALNNFTIDAGVAQFFAGSCDQADKIDTWVHLAINALSTILLGCSNYCMQILSAPTRKEIDQAHASKKWLDVGVPSVRNLRHIAVGKMLMWGFLGLSSVPLHLMYNSAIFTTLASNEYAIVYAHEAFIHGASYDAPDEMEYAALQDIQTRVKDWDRLANIDCINAYATAFLSDRRDLLAVIRDTNTTDDNSVKHFIFYQLADKGYPDFDLYAWICNTPDRRYDTDNDFNHDSSCAEKLPNVQADAENWNSEGHAIDYCLSEPVQGKCTLHFSVYIIIVVMLCNIGKALTMFVIAFRIKDRPLLTLGDAIDSFLSVIDPTTHGMCLVDKKSINSGESVQDYYCAAYGCRNPHTYTTQGRVSDPTTHGTCLVDKKSINSGESVQDYYCAAYGCRNPHTYITQGKVSDPVTHGTCLVDKKSINSGENVQDYYCAAYGCRNLHTYTTQRRVSDPTIHETVPYGCRNPHTYTTEGRVSSNWKESSVAYKSKTKRWCSSASVSRWLACMLLLFCCTATVSFLFAWGVLTAEINFDRGIKVLVKELKDIGFGAVNPSTVIQDMAIVPIGGSTLIPNVLIANVPQTILSFLYLLFNGIFTTMLLANEWSHFAHERKALRVSNPKPGQRSTYFLELPYRYAIPLMTLSGVLHWGVSQSIFLARVAIVNRKDEVVDSAAVSTCGYSPAAIIFTMALTFCLTIFAIVLGLCRYKPGIPLAGSCSAVISAACHANSEVDTTVPLQWGVTSEEGADVGHCSFSDGPVEKPREGAVYAGLKKRSREQKCWLELDSVSGNI